MQKQRLIFLIVGVVLGLIAVVMVNIYMKDTAENAKKQAQKTLEKMRQNQAVILVAKQDIPADTAIQRSMLETMIVPREYVQPQAASSLDSVNGMIVVAPISRGEQISLSKLTSGGQVKKRDLAAVTPFGKRAVAVTAENISDVLGLINPGDNVDLIAVLSIPKKDAAANKMIMQQTIVPVFQNVLILAVGQETEARSMSGKSPKDSKTTQITVALDPKEASMLTFLQEQGKIRIALRSARDTQVIAAEPVTWESILERIPELRQPEEAPKPKQETIEIYRGLTRELIPVSE